MVSTPRPRRSEGHARDGGSLVCCARMGRDLSAPWRNTRPRGQEYPAQDTPQAGGASSGGASAQSPGPPPGSQRPASQPDVLAVSGLGQRGEDAGGTNEWGLDPRGVEPGVGGGELSDDVTSGVGYISGSGRARLCCSYCSAGVRCREAGGWAGRQHSRTQILEPRPPL